MKNDILKAVYETKRENLLISYLNATKNGKALYPKGYIFAYLKRLCPIFDENPDIEDPFKEVYEVKKDMIDDILKYCDDHHDREGMPLLTYRKLEDHFKPVGRCELINVIKYMKMSDRFDDSFYKNLLDRKGMPPAEASSINRKFTDNDIIIGG
ncbi:MAG: hypothetical protein EOM62_17535 [Bacteroidia bacterium]|nr:hypothetical protein [Bacteroidia bacterium]